MQKMINEFRLFVLRGNVVDFVFGIVMATGFRAIVDSWVDDIIMPPLGLIFKGIDLTQWEIVLKPATENSTAVAIRIGQFLNVTIEFVLLLIACFIFIKIVNGMMEQIKEKKVPQKSENQQIIELMERVATALEKQNQANGIL